MLKAARENLSLLKRVSQSMTENEEYTEGSDHEMNKKQQTPEEEPERTPLRNKKISEIEAHDATSLRNATSNEYDLRTIDAVEEVQVSQL